MQDLLNEEEFIKKPYNPWKRFMVFYAVAVVHVLLFFFMALHLELNEVSRLIGIPLLFLIPAMPFIMIFSKKANRSLDKRTLMLSVCLLMMVYFLTYLAADVAYNGIYFLFSSDQLIAMAVCLGYALLSVAFIIPLAGRLDAKK